MRTGTQVALGGGHTATFVWRDGVDPERGVPFGAELRHLSTRAAGATCCAVLHWAPRSPDDRSDDLWTLESLVPLTLREGVECPICGVRFYVRDGRVRPW